MKSRQLTLIPRSRTVIPMDVITALKEGVVLYAQEASDMTLRMRYLDPDHTRAQTIGTYLRDNFTARLEDAYINQKAPFLRATVKGQQFKLCIDSANGISYSFPIHRCGSDNVPKGARRLKRDVRSIQNCSLIKQQQPGLFIGVIFDEETGLIKIFLGQLCPEKYKTKYHTEILSMLYSKSVDSIDVSRIIRHEEYEEIAEPIVNFSKK